MTVLSGDRKHLTFLEGKSHKLSVGRSLQLVEISLEFQRVISAVDLSEQ